MWYKRYQFMHGSHTWNPLFDDTDGTFANETVTTLYCLSQQSHMPTVPVKLFIPNQQHHLHTHFVVVKYVPDAAVMY